ncbi:MAG: amino acid adenylation domain-containing protein [Candidatus Aminicenantes bacterium]|nr:MAG: amino acid adenylation domain-containing protein [Candidatus Aminicenantes bacterium]
MIIGKFEEQVKRFSEKPGVITENKQLTYGELNNCANATALAIQNHHSISSKKKENHVVGLLFEHSADMIVGVLGTLKAEKIYVPLDITYPENRLVYMLEDSGADLVLTNTNNLSLAEKLVKKVSHDLPIINIDTLDKTIAYPGIERRPSGDRLAYILYTSGSTGKPKGVWQNHENVCYYIRNWSERFSITPADRMTLFSAFSHDGAGQDMFGALHNGAVLYPYNILNRTNIADLARWLIDEKITIWHSVPTLYRYFVETLKNRGIEGGQFPDLRFILLGGEQIREHDIEMFRRFFPGARFANVYGQTESSVDSIWMVNPGDTINKILIGEPLDKTELLIVDNEGTVLEDMGVGEIIAACPHLALGYWNDKQSSEEVFLHDPDLGLLYRTGDLGRLRTDGTIEIMGRKDSQVKIRGFRIEVGEVETTLLDHPLIKETIVTARTDDNGNAHLYAYYVPDPSASAPGGDRRLTVSEMRKYLSRELPEHMIPSYFVELEEMPLTPNGKVDRKRLPEPGPGRAGLGVTYAAPGTQLEKQLSDIWRTILRMDKVGIDDNFFDLGGTSFDILRITSKLYEVYKKDIPVVSIFRYPTIRSFAGYLRQEESSRDFHQQRKPRPSSASTPIAVIGMAGRFPGAQNLHEFWENLKNGMESLSFFSTPELEQKGVDRQLVLDSNYVTARGVLADIEYFDASFFNYSPHEAGLMDPQLRLLHECSWEALENAGYNPDNYDGLIGLYAGNAPNQYWVALTYINQKSAVDTVFLNSNYSTKVSYKLNLKGPSVIVQTACSTSLVAIHFACQGLSSGECDMALAGGVSISLPDREGYLYREGMLFSRDGHCRTFAANANGTIFGNGVGMVVLKRLADAIAHGDSIDAVIKGTAVNNDGNRKVGITAPSVEGQAEVIAAAHQVANLDPENITYVEAHGTGTLLGDPVEIEALKLAFDTDKRGYCAIGSVKTNMGHLNSASGVAGFIKTVLALKTKTLPPSLHFEVPNPKIDFESSPFYTNTQLKEWKSNRQGQPLQAGVSSFGIGGTNAHVILEEAPEETRGLASLSTRQYQLILLSAKTQSALEKTTENFIRYMKMNPGIPLADAAYTLQVGRKTFKYRKMLVCSRLDELSGFSSSPIYTVEEGEKPVVFMFPGLGSQYVNMGRELYTSVSLFREEMDRCFEILNGLLDYDIKEILYQSDQSDQSDRSDTLINQTEIAQLVVFIFEYSLAKLLMGLGIEPYALMGYSFGEYAAACLSGVLSLEEMLKLVVLRGHLIQTVPGGAMLSVPAPAEELKPLLTESGGLSIAVDNGASCIVSGPSAEIDAFENQMKEKRYLCMRLNTLHALHSSMMAPISEKFAAAVRDFTFHKPVIPYISNVTGTWITVEDAVEPGYWTTHLQQTVRFADGMQKLSKITGAVFIEVGPGRDLATLIKRYLPGHPDQHAVDLIRVQGKSTSDLLYFLNKIGQLWVQGIPVNGSALHRGEKRHRVHLTTYPFERERFWFEGVPFKISETMLMKKAPTGKIPDITDWFYIPSWKPSEIPEQKAPQPVKNFNWLLFIDDIGIGYQLQSKLKQGGHQVAVVRPGDQWASTGIDEYTVYPTRQKDYDTLLEELCSLGKIPRRIVHLWNVTGTSADPGKKGNRPGADRDLAESMQELGYYSLLNLARAIGKQDITDEIEITVVTDGMQGMRGDDLRYPQKATILGPLQVIPREYANINCRSIDIEIPSPVTTVDEGVVSYLLTELLAGIADPVVAFRVNQRWVRTFEARPLYRTGREASRLKQGGIYLITGGLGGIGLELAKYLAETVKARLVLTARRPLPHRHQWQELLNSGEAEEDIAIKIRKVRELEDLGAQVLVYGADAANRQQMQHVIAETQEKLGKINGVLHAAGVPDGTIIQRRNQEMCQRVLNPKVTGTLILDELLKEDPLDFFILFSSTVAVTALGGQVAYCAANAFLDQFARYKSVRDGAFTVSINWDAWQRIGMAAKAVKKAAAAPRKTRVNHPLLHSREGYGPDHQVWTSHLKTSRHWVLEEHRILGQATLPGTAYLEMARAAFEPHSADSIVVELRDIYFLTPLTVGESEEKEVRTIIKKRGPNYTFSIISRRHPGEDQWVEHARGNAAAVKKEPPRTYDIHQLKEACNGEKMTFPVMGHKSQRGAMTFGPRWDNTSEVRYDKNRGVAVLQLPGAFVEDIGLYSLHPALLDVATTFLRPMVQKEGAYMPFYYKRLRIKGTFPGKIVCYTRFLDQETHEAKKETLKFDVTIMDEQGIELADIEEFTLKRVQVEADEARYKLEGQWETEPETPGENPENENPGIRQMRQESRKDPLKDAILPGEGIEAFLRILSGEGHYQVLVSTTDLYARLQHLQGLTEEFHRQRFRDERELPSLPKHCRPELSTPYTAPGTRMEHILAGVWQELLGIETVGIDDDFFELGGDSLKAVSFAGRIHKKTNTEVPLAEFFDRPTIRQLAQFIESKSKKTQFSSIQPIEKREYYGLSPAQKRLYILHKMEAETIGYNLFSAVLLEGEPDMRRWDNGVKQLIKRHEAFRTSFEMVGDDLVQRVYDEVAFEIEVLSALPYKEKTGGIRGLTQLSAEPAVGDPQIAVSIIKNFIAPFDLSRAPLIRVGVIKQEERKYILVVDIHHIVYDGTSMAIFFKEFMELYGVRGKELPALRLQYRDYAEWQFGPAALVRKQEQEKYWLGVFSHEIPVLNLPLDFPRPLVQSYEGSRWDFVLEEKITNTLKTIAKENKVTLYMLVLAAINVLLMKLSGQEDIVVGTVLAGRKHSDWQHIIGMFVNTLALRNYPGGAKTFREFLGEIKEQTLNAFENQDYPFEELVDRLKVERDASRNPIFDVMFRLHNFETPGGEIQETRTQGLKLTRYKFNPHTSIFDLNFGCREADNTLVFNIDYCTALFKEKTIERFIGYSRKILAVVQHIQDKKLSDIEIIDEKEKKQLLIDFNATNINYPEDKTIYQLFAEQAEQTPDHIAVIGMDHGPWTMEKSLKSITYRELNKKAGQLAFNLKEKGVKPGTIAAIMVNRTIRMMVGLLGILKAGGTYLPLDPEYPESRIKYIIEKSSTRVLVTQKNLIDKCKDMLFAGEMIDIFAERLSGEIVGEKKDYRARQCSSLAPAYVIYTSGSTGNPKGVLVQHKNAVNFIKGMTSVIDFLPGKSILALTTISFDIFFLETLLPVTRGMKVFIADEAQQKDPQLLEEIILSQQVNMLQLTPSRLQLLLSYKDNLHYLSSAAEMIVGGEAFPVHLFEQVREKFAGKIYNVYGPTETTIWSTIKDLTRCETGELTIGSPIANTRVYIVDRHSRIQPLGVSGELLIGGDGVASGYLNNPELTAEKFINYKLQIQNNPGHYRSYKSYKTYILYKTGDLVRWLPGGEIEFLGRFDHQVKIRGFRIELEEIEEQLLGHKGIKEAVVTAKTVKEGDNYLAAYIVPEFPGEEKEFDVDQLRDYLARQLPPYMIPSYFILLENIPLTPNGKINRRALPDPGQSRPQLSTNYAAPRSDQEKTIAQLWRGVLNVDKIGIYDNFFDLGGNSLRLIQLNEKLKETLGKDIPVITIFRYPTIESLLQYLGQGDTGTGMTDGQIDEVVGDLEETMGMLVGTYGE